MTTITSSATARTDSTPAFWRPAAIAVVAAAAATTLVAAVAHAAGVSLVMSGEPIPATGFGTLTLIFGTLGLGIAAAIRRWANRPRQAFVRTTIALTAASLIPDLVVSVSLATRLTLMATHLVAAAIVIPVVAARLARERS